jgi:HK97 family phage portal protein
MGLFSLFTRDTAPPGGWPSTPHVPIVDRASKEEKPQYPYIYTGKAQAGVNVSHDSALTYASVWACVKVITEDIGQMSWHVFKPTENGKKVYLPNNPVNFLLLQQANPEMSAMTFRETLLAWALTWGNGYAEIVRDLGGRVSELWPIAPDRVNPDRTADGTLYYDIINRGGPNTVLAAPDVFHLHGLGYDGTMGYSVISYARQSLGLGLAMERFGSKFFGNGARPSVVLEHPGQLGPTARKNITESFKLEVGGDNQLGMAVLEEGMKLNTFSVQPNDAQFLESRQFQIDEVCRWFRVTAQKVANLMRATFNNVEHLDIAHVKDTLVPWVTRLEQEADLKLFGSNRQNLFSRINVNSLLRGDFKSRNDAYSIGRNGGWLTPNDILRLEDMDPIESEYGDSYLAPVNMRVIGQNGNVLFEPTTATGQQIVTPSTTEPARNGALH